MEKQKPKKKLSVTVDQDLYDWMRKEIQSKRFASESHAVDYALYHLKNCKTPLLQK